MPEQRRIDSHQHCWALARGDYGWLTPAAGILYADFQPADLLPLLRQNGVSQTVLVQAAPTVAETEYLLQLAARSRFIGGVVGWVDLLAEDLDATLDRLTAQPALKGVRPMLQELPDDAWIDQPALDRAARALIAHGLRFDALVHPRHLPHLLAFARRHPRLPIVIDHLAKPSIGRGSVSEWRDALAPLAALDPVHAKLSGLITEAGPGWSVQSLKPYVDAALELFTPQRLMWGSDWPVLNLAGDYERWVAASETLLGALSASEQQAVWSVTAIRFYGLTPGDF